MDDDILSKLISQIPEYCSKQIEMPELPNEADKLVDKLWEVMTEVRSAIPSFGLAMAFIREKSPKAEIESTVKEIEKVAKQLRERLDELAEEVADFQQLKEVMDMDVLDLRIEAQKTLYALIGDVNSLRDDYCQLIMAFALHSLAQIEKIAYTPTMGMRYEQ